KGERLDMKVREEEFAIAFYIGKDFEKSYQRAGLEKGLGRVINEAFNGRTSVEAFEEGGVVRLVVVEKTALGRFVRYERVRAIEYRPPDPEKAPERAYWFEGQGKGGYVDEKGRKPSAQGWRSPCPGAPVTSHFNPTRLHPVLKKVMPHNGTDFGAPAGTPVYAAFRGEVSWVGMRGASGNLVLIEHPGGVQTGYAHLSRFAPSLKVGDKVGTRQLVGYVGSTGRSTGPHLHFSAKRDGKFFDALELKLDAITLLPVGDRATFMGQKQSLDQALESIPLPEPPAPEPEPQPEPDQADPDGAESPEPAEGADEGADERSDEGPDEGDEGSSDDGGDEADQGESDEGRDEPKPSSGSEDLGSDLSGPDLSGDFE
ncbi:MAG: peptidoglycan DD-metalloendopeptidase family protein, partial [Myxococcales bacterium]|nr:peptidoglycan DD-metalloendopeptidase family protein [Myxococcales bacterium]